MDVVDEAVLPRQLTTKGQQQHEELHRAHLLLSHKLYWDRGPVFSRDRDRVTGNCRTGPHILSQSHWGQHECGSEKVRIEHKGSGTESKAEQNTRCWGLNPKRDGVIGKAEINEQRGGRRECRAHSGGRIDRPVMEGSGVGVFFPGDALIECYLSAKATARGIFSRQHRHSDGLWDKPHDKWTQALRALTESGRDAQAQNIYTLLEQKLA